MAGKSKTSILKLMEGGYNKNVADEIIHFCVKQKEEPAATFLQPDRLTGQAYKSWTADEAIAYIEAELKAKRDAVKTRPDLESPLDIVCARAAIALLSEHLVVCKDQGVSLYQIINQEHRLVAPIYADNQSAQVSHLIQADVHAQQIACSHRSVSRWLDLFMHNAQLQGKPQLWAQIDDDCWALGRAVIQPDSNCPWPNFRTVIDRLNDPEAFGAWFYGIYSGRYRGRQMMYISDTEGQSGKSSAVRPLQRLFEYGQSPNTPSITAALNSNILRESSHASAQFAGKRFVWVGDNKNPAIFHSQAVKELSGDDMAMINPKHLPAYSTYLEAHLLVLGNCEPTITSERHNTSRTLWLKLSPLRVPKEEISADFARKYDEEMPGFLAWGKECYERRCTSDYEIVVNDAVQAATALKIAEHEDEFSLPFAECFELSADGILTAAELNVIMFGELKWDKFKAQHFKAWLERTYDIVKSKDDRSKAWCYHGIQKLSARSRRGGSDTLMAGIGQNAGMRPFVRKDMFE